ncbi:MAG: hypothetical protein D6695_10560 [Planctomycetota bacterium]|nr:MAG: hypothetical protein D6695_10560 [Planctomycetota bacterium]
MKQIEALALLGTTTAALGAASVILLARAAPQGVSLVLVAYEPRGDVLIQGTVTDQSTGDPIEGALISLQAQGVRTTTQADGSYQLWIPDVLGSRIVAAAPGYYNLGQSYDEGTTIDFALTETPRVDDPSYHFVAPINCAGCHPNQYAEWNGSPMANAGINTWVHDIFSGTGTPGGMGGFVYQRDSVFADTNPNSECASCHQPESWIPEPFTRMENPTDDGYPSPAAAHGISCEVCHKVADVDVSKINFPGIFPGAVEYNRPATGQQVMYGMLGDADFEITSVMQPAYQPLLAAEVCAACHQDKNDPDENHTYTGVTSEPTYIEWLESPYSDPGSPHFATCVDCHMPPTGQTQACSVLQLTRDPSTIRSHDIRGTTPEFLESAVELDVSAELIDHELHVQVDITNNGTGHRVPTGVTIRNMILLVEAFRQSGGDPLTFTGTQVVHDLGGIGDPSQGYFAGLPGKFFAKVNHNAQGEGPTFFTDATGIQFDNRIEPLATDSSSYVFAAPPGLGDIEVRARLIYRRSFRFLVDAKGWTEDGHANPLEDVLPPHFGHLMESAELTVNGPCIADLAAPFGSLDFFDVLAFLANFSSEDPIADVNGDDTFDFFDVLAFLQVFSNGCS